MGRAAKFCKRTKKVTTAVQTTPKNSTSTTTPISKLKAKTHESAAELARKQAGLKAKAAAYKRKPGAEGPVLGGADYVGAMFGGRRRAMREAEKMPVDEE